MPLAPPKPAGSTIEEIADFDGPTYRWKKPSGGPFRYFIAAFLGLWLCGWTGGLIAVGTMIFQGKAKGAADLFLIFWLAGWLLGGAFAIFMLYMLLRTPRPESVTLGFSSFRYDSGTNSAVFFVNPWYAMRQAASSPWPFMFRRRKQIEIRKSELGPIVLGRAGERQRLTFDYGADRIEIGEFLREPEREWLAAVIAAWQTAP